jgi:ligand-binding SRPBCC domain-containing protein
MWSAAATAPRSLIRLHRDTVVQAPVAETFAFFAEASNLERLTPPWLRFSIVSEIPLMMRAGLEIEYRIHLYGVPIRWVTVIDVWEPGVRFVDRQVVGPYRWWRHEHRFAPAGDATRLVDDVEYQPRAAWMTGWIVRRDVERVFDFRQAALPRMFSQKPA